MQVGWQVGRIVMVSAAGAIRGATACRPACAAARRRIRPPPAFRACRACRRGTRAARRARTALRPALQLDEGLCGLAAILVGNADHDHLLHAWMGVDRLLDHLRIDVEAAGDDHVLLAVDQIEIAVGVHVADVAGEEAVADEGLRGFLRPVPVALGDVRALDADLADFARRQHLRADRPATTTSISMPGSIRPIEPGLSGPSGGWPVPGEQVSVMPQPLCSFMPTLRSKILATSTGSGAPPEPTVRQRGQIALVEIGKRGDRDPHRRHAGKYGRALDLDVAHHGLDVEALVQRDQIAAAERATAARRSARRCETAAARRSRARSRRARRARRLAPDVVDRHRRGEIAVASASRPWAGRWCRRYIAAARRRRR